MCRCAPAFVTIITDLSHYCGGKTSLRGNYCHFNDFNKQNRKQFLPKTTKNKTKQKPAWMEQFKFKCLTIIYINRIENWSPSSQSTWNLWKQNNNPLLQFQFDFNTVESVTNERLLNAWLFNNSFKCKHHAYSIWSDSLLI